MLTYPVTVKVANSAEYFTARRAFTSLPR